MTTNIIPIIILCLVLAIVAIILVPTFEWLLRETSKRNKLKKLFPKIDSMGGFEFEQYIKGLYEQAGYQVQTTPMSGDQGADLVLTKDGIKTAVQIKRSRGFIGNSAVQEVTASKNFYHCSKAIVVTNSTFTKSAWQLAIANHVWLIDRKRLQKMIYQYL